MTQGYGPENGQQGQWGQGGQNPPPAPHPQQQPQWGQPEQASPAPQPQWGQSSPAGASGGYPGTVGRSDMGAGPQFRPGDGVNWNRVKLIGLILLVGTVLVLLVRLGINLASFIGAEDMAATDTGGELGGVGIGSSLVGLVLYIANFLLGLSMFVLGIVAAVMGRGRARVGGIVVAAAIPVSIVLYWIFTVVMAAILMASGGADAESGAITSAGYRITAGATTLHALLIVALLGLGSYFVHRTASKKLAA
ncbi:MAG: hypothetical protein ACTH1O_01605 [Brachybacterium sp.]